MLARVIFLAHVIVLVCIMALASVVVLTRVMVLTHVMVLTCVMVLARDGWGRGSHGLSARRVRRTESSWPEELLARSRGPEGPRLLVLYIIFYVYCLMFNVLYFV